MTRIIPETLPDYDKTRILERPDGFYWLSETGDKDVGPFATLFEAVQAVQYPDDSELAPAETLRQAEEEIGIAEWVDPNTGEPAEEGIPRLEEH
jgi:hypothetical protein